MSNNIIPISRDAEFPKRPAGAHEKDGYVYVVEFSDGTVKVGKARNLRGRLSNHRQDAEKFALSINRWWGSSLHRGYEDSEKHLIAHAAAMGELQGGREYFTGVNFDLIVAHAMELEMEPTPEDIARAEAEQTRESVKEFFGPMVDHKRPTVGVDSWHAAVALSAFFDSDQQLPALGNSLPAEMISQLELLAEDIASRGDSTADEVLQWGNYEWLCHLLDTSVEIAKINMRIRIKDEEREDLYEPWLLQCESV